MNKLSMIKDTLLLFAGFASLIYACILMAPIFVIIVLACFFVYLLGIVALFLFSMIAVFVRKLLPSTGGQSSIDIVPSSNYFSERMEYQQPEMIKPHGIQGINR